MSRHNFSRGIHINSNLNYWRYPINIAIISIPTSGHVHVLAKMASAIKKDQPNLHIKFILTSWPDFKLNQKVKELLTSSCDEQLILQGETRQGLTHFERAHELTDEIIEKCRDCTHIIYDFLSPEGYLAGKALNIPAICTNPAIIGPFEPNDTDYLNALKHLIWPYCDSRKNMI